MVVGIGYQGGYQKNLLTLVEIDQNVTHLFATT